MEKPYRISRKRASLKAAQEARGHDSGLAHYDLAGGYSVKAASAETAAIDLHNALPPPIFAAKYQTRLTRTDDNEAADSRRNL
jgi:hypothetical protein